MEEENGAFLSQRTLPGNGGGGGGYGVQATVLVQGYRVGVGRGLHKITGRSSKPLNEQMRLHPNAPLSVFLVAHLGLPNVGLQNYFQENFLTDSVIVLITVMRN